MARGSTSSRVALCALAALLGACGGDPAPLPWQVVDRHLPAALLNVWGTTATDVYAVGGDLSDGKGPFVEHYDGTSWTQLPTGQVGNLWWVFGFPGGPTYFGGDGGMILSYANGTFTKMTTPGHDTVFGIWGSSPDDVWAVGGALGGASGGFAWRLQPDHQTWAVAPGLPADLANEAIWKVYGRSASDAWMVATNGKAVHWDGTALTEVVTGTGESLFTVHADADRYVAVGGFGTGSILENEGSGWHDASPHGAPGLVGVCVSPSGSYAVGQSGAIYRRGDSGWTADTTGLTFDESFHSVWIDPDGGVWAVGGDVLALPLVNGVMVYEGKESIKGFQ